MNKFFKLMLTGLVLGGLALPITGCVKPVEPFYPPESEGGKVIINDAYDWDEDETGSTRPDLGGGYVPAVPPSAIELTIDASSPIRFKGGETTYKLPVSEKLKASDFDSSTLDGHTVGGIAYVGEEGVIERFVSLEDFEPNEALTIIPYYAPEKGKTMFFGDTRLGDYFWGADGTDLSKDEDYKLGRENALINGEAAGRINTQATLAKGTNFRVMTSGDNEVGQIYTYHYGIKNFGETSVSLTLYHMFTGGDITNENNCIKGESLVIAPGEYKTTTITIRYNDGSLNAGAMTMIRVDEDTVGLDIGVTLANENVTPSSPATITLNLPDGFTVSDSYNRNVNTNEKLILPTERQIRNQTGHIFRGWVYSNSNNSPVVEGERIKGDISIEPLLSEDINIEFILPDGISVKSDYKFVQQSGEKLVLPTNSQLVNTTNHRLKYWQYEEGGIINDKVVLSYDLRIKGVFTEDVKVTFELPEGLKLSDGYSTLYQEGDKIVLPTDEQMENGTGHKVVRWLDGNGDVVTNNTVVYEGMTITPELSQSATISLKLPAGLSVSSDYVTAVETGDLLTVPTSEQIKGTIFNGRAIEGWYIVGGNNEIITEKSVIYETEITIAPYFTRMEGTAKNDNGAALVFADVQGNLKPHNVYDENGANISNAYNNFDAVNTSNAYVIGGGNGYAERGNILHYNGTLGKDYRFRGGASISSKGAIHMNTPYTFYWNFENFGSTAIDFTVYGLNNGTDYTEDKTGCSGVRVQLKPGESIRISYDVNYKTAYNNQVNNNAMTYFYINEEVTDMKLGVAVNVILDVANTNIEDEKANNVNVTVDLPAGLTLSNYRTVRKEGSKLVLPAAEQIENETGHNILGWTDAAGNPVSGDTVLTGDITIKPVLSVDVTVTITGLPEGVTVKDTYKTVCQSGDILVLPTKDDLNNTTGNNLLGWTDADGDEIQDGLTLTEDITIKPVFSYDVTVTITGLPEGVTVKETYKTVWQSGEKLVLPTKDDLNNTTGKNLLGWTDAKGDKIQDGLTLTEDITIKPVFSTPANVTLNLPENFTVSSEYKTLYEVGDEIILPTEAQITNNTGKVLKHWINSETKEIINDGDIIESETLTIEPEFKAEVTVTLKLPAGVTVDGYKANQFKEETLTLPENVTDTTGNGDILGWYDTATNEAVTAETVLNGDMTIAPYWQTMAGYSYLDIGSGSNSGYNTDEMPGDIAKNISASNYCGSTKAAPNKPVIVGNFRGSSLKIDNFVSAGSAIRLDSVRPGDSKANAAKYEFSYSVENRSTAKLHISIYQINASGEYKKAQSYYGYESRYRTEITLAAGECKTVKGQYDLGNNGNFMTFIVVEKDVESINFAIAIGYKDVTEIDAAYTNQAALVNPADIAYNPEDNGGIIVKDSYLKQRAGRFALAPKAADFENPGNEGIVKWQLVIGENTYDLKDSVSSWTDVLVPSSGATLKVVLAEPVTVTLQGDNGVNVEGAKTAYKTGEKLALPELTATTADGRTHAGWFNPATGAIVTNDTVVEGAMTIAPYFTPAGALTPLSGASASEKGCPYGPDNCSSTSLEGNFVKTSDMIAGDEKGIILGYNGTLAENDAFRFKTAFNVAAKTYKYTYKFTNYGASEMKFTVYQITGGTDTEGMPKQEVTLAAGASDKVELTITYTGTNGNALTYFVMGGAVENMSLGVAMSVTEVTA